MTEEEHTTDVLTLSERNSGLVVRSEVPPGLRYREYRTYLRPDFTFSCAYCTMTEAEASAKRFTIDHYEPVSARRELEHDYSNLMYACDTCNVLKGNRSPPPEARADGHRFFRPDQDRFADHFEESELLLKHKTNTGEYTIEMIDLNRLHLRKLRAVRSKLYEVHEYVVEGLRGLKRVHLDRLPQPIKGRALTAMRRAERVGAELVKAIDEILAADAQSPNLEPDPETANRAAGRSQKQGRLQKLYPGRWRG